MALIDATPRSTFATAFASAAQHVIDVWREPGFQTALRREAKRSPTLGRRHPAHPRAHPRAGLWPERVSVPRGRRRARLRPDPVQRHRRLDPEPARNRDTAADSDPRSSRGRCRPRRHAVAIHGPHVLHAGLRRAPHAPRRGSGSLRAEPWRARACQRDRWFGSSIGQEPTGSIRLERCWA